MKGFFAGSVIFMLSFSGSVSVSAQPASPGIPGTASVVPPPPDPVSRAEGRTIVRAIRLREPLRVDGNLDETVYEEVPPVSDFIQQEPEEGQPATERTEAWIFFDDDNVYISARCWDSQPDRAIANEMRRDSNNIIQNENFAVTFDTLNDGRDGVLFQLNKLGGLLDVAITDERDRNPDWNAVWDARTADFDQGWTAEVVIPFKSLRYDAGREQTWGVQMRRIVRWKNEWSYLTPVPAFMGPRAMLAVSLGATLEGLEAPPAGKNIDFKPYSIFGTRSDRTVSPAVTNDFDGDIGFDFKYGVTKSLTADVTYNTDFAQVENDEQQVNLTRFNLFFPEKRDFFLEGQGIFAFGGAGATTRGGPVSAPVMFFSRRIGLSDGRPVPINAGGRLTGKAGNYSIGIVNIQSGEDEAAGARSTNFSVLRVKRDLFQRSNVGVIYTRRSVLSAGDGVGETFGVDALASFSTSVNFNVYYARTRTPGRSGRDASYMARFDYDTDRYGVQLDHTVVQENFNPEVGFLRRENFDRRFVQARFSPRPAPGRMAAIRKFYYVASYDDFRHGSGRLDTRDVQGSVEAEFQNSDRAAIEYTHQQEYIPSPFRIATEVTVPVGQYEYQAAKLTYTLGAQRRLAGALSYEGGTFYDGRKHIIAYSTGRIGVTPRFSVEPSVSINKVDLPQGEFTTSVISTRSTFTLTPRMFVAALVQYSSAANALTTNARFRWEYLPGSELFLVYTDGRDTLASGFPDLSNRALVVKANRLIRF